MTLTVRFDHDQAGAPVAVVDGFPGLTTTLADSVSSQRPVGVGGPTISTFRVDGILHAIDADRASNPTGSRGSPAPIELSSGNTTRLVLAHDHVRADSLHDLFESEHIPVDDMVEILRCYREAIVDAAGCDDPQPFLRPPDTLWVAGATGVELPAPSPPT